MSKVRWRIGVALGLSHQLDVQPNNVYFEEAMFYRLPESMEEGGVLSEASYNYLRGIIQTRQIELPSFGDRSFHPCFVAQHGKCHLTAAQAAIEFGQLPVVGIQLLDVHNKLLPWAHMVNRNGASLVDYSPRAGDQYLGFIETGWHEFDQWREITEAYTKLSGSKLAATWGDRLADALSHEYLMKLRCHAHRMPYPSL